MAALGTAPATFTYEQIAPVDWFQWRTLLWDYLTPAATGSLDWVEIATGINGKCPDSSPQSATVYRSAFVHLLAEYSDLTRTVPPAGLGMKLWSETLYREVSRTLGICPPFLNLGCSPAEGNQPCTLGPEDEPYRLHIELYRQLAAFQDLHDCKILEVGCGTGGGCSYLKRYVTSDLVTGVDLLVEHIRAAREMHVAGGLTFLQGDAERLPIDDNSYDAVFSVESSGHYSSIDRFLAEVCRVLRPGGTLLLADLRPKEEEWGTGRGIRSLRNALSRANLAIEQERDISSLVRSSIDLQETGRSAFLSSRCGDRPTILAHFREILLLTDSVNYSMLADGRLQYWAFACRKLAQDI